MKHFAVFGFVCTLLWFATGGIALIYLHFAGLFPERHFAESSAELHVHAVGGRTIRLLAVTEGSSIPTPVPSFSNVTASVTSRAGSVRIPVAVPSATSLIVSRRNNEVVASAVLFAEITPSTKGELSISVDVPPGANYRVAAEVSPWPMVWIIFGAGIGTVLIAVAATKPVMRRLMGRQEVKLQS